MPRRTRRSAGLDHVPGRHLLDVHGRVRGSTDRQRVGVLRGRVLRPDALGHQSVHYEHGRRRPADDAVLRAVLVRVHVTVAVLAVRQRPLPHRQLRAGHRSAGNDNQ